MPVLPPTSVRTKARNFPADDRPAACLTTLYSADSGALFCSPSVVIMISARPRTKHLPADIMACVEFQSAVPASLALPRFRIGALHHPPVGGIPALARAVNLARIVLDRKLAPAMRAVITKEFASRHDDTHHNRISVCTSGEHRHTANSTRRRAGFGDWSNHAGLPPKTGNALLPDGAPSRPHRRPRAEPNPS